MRYLIKFSYDGSNYSGFQKQPGLLTIEEEMDKALTKINNNNKTNIIATGRTDYVNMVMPISMLILMKKS